MKKFILIIFLFINLILCLNTYANTIEVKVPLDMSKMWLTCSPDSWVYKCSITTWFWSVKDSIWQIIKYFTFITWLAWVLYIIINWIMLSMAWINQWLETKAKENIKKSLIWLIILLLSWAILNFIAPWVYT